MALRIGILLLLSSLAGCTTAEQIDGDRIRPEPTRFNYSVVVDGLDEPFQLEFDQQGHVYWIERSGALKRIHEPSGRVEELGTLPLYEDAPGLIGLLLAKDFEQSRQLYLYYSPAEDGGNMRLSRFTLGPDGSLEMSSETTILEIPWEQPDGQHYGGGMTWDQEGNLYLSVGDDTRASQYEPIHYLNEEGSTDVFDAARTAGNTNDLRGAILRIRPQPDGSYTIPEGNLFAGGTPDTRPEIYIMGNRNPWRLSVDSETGYLHWAKVGPDAGADSETRGPRGYDEFNVAREAGNYGWPFVVGQNLPYNRYNYETRTYGSPYELDGPINNSPNNTGLQQLPPARPALVAYPYAVSEQWPILGSAARSGVGGPIFRRSDFPAEAPRVFPDYYEGKWIVTDYVRNWIMVITMNEDRTEAVDIERLLPADRLGHSQPLDMDFGPSGDLYMVEYGSAGQGRIGKYMYNPGNRPPQARAIAGNASGAIPFEVQLSSDGTVDYDGDELDYEWVVRSESGDEMTRLTQANPIVALQQAGRYKAVLTVTDPAGSSSSDSVEIVAGNQRPDVTIEITDGNRTFYFPDSEIRYQVQVSDPEDRQIPPDRVHLTAEYIPSGLSPSQLGALQTQGSQTSLRHLQAQQLIAENNCSTCHRMEETLVGPAFQAVAENYSNSTITANGLAQSILGGSQGTWGEIPMPPQAMLSETEATQVADYILSLAGQETSAQEVLPIQGRFTTAGQDFAGGGGRLSRFYDLDYQPGSYVLHAEYTDRGHSEVEGLALTGEDLVLLRYPLVEPQTADFFSEEGISYTPSTRDPGFIVSGPRSYLGFEQIDLTGINRIGVGALTRFYNWVHFIGGTVEVRLDSPGGRIVGEPQVQSPPESTGENITYLGRRLDAPVEIDVSDVSGTHDVYIVFQNPEADTDDALLIITGIEFMN